MFSRGRARSTARFSSVSPKRYSCLTSSATAAASLRVAAQVVSSSTRALSSIRGRCTPPASAGSPGPRATDRAAAGNMVEICSGDRRMISSCSSRRSRASGVSSLEAPSSVLIRAPPTSSRHCGPTGPARSPSAGPAYSARQPRVQRASAAATRSWRSHSFCGISSLKWARPSVAIASWVRASGRQIDAAVAMLAFSAVNDSIHSGPV